jgi:hypothetical protein
MECGKLGRSASIAATDFEASMEPGVSVADGLGYGAHSAATSPVGTSEDTDAFGTVGVGVPAAWVGVTGGVSEARNGVLVDGWAIDDSRGEGGVSCPQAITAVAVSAHSVM